MDAGPSHLRVPGTPILRRPVVRSARCPRPFPRRSSRPPPTCRRPSRQRSKAPTRAGGSRFTTTAAGIPFSALTWGDPADRPLVLIHGVTASARIWWRVGPALAATGRRVVAVDQAGHGLTGHWQGHHRFRDNAADVAAWIRAAGLDVPDVQIVGHSWGGMTAAALPRSGIRPATLVLLDPPAVPHALISLMASDPSEMPITRPRRPTGDGLAAAEPELVGRGRPRQGGGARPGRSSRPLARSCSTTATGTAAWPTCPIPPPMASRPG